MEEIKKLTKTLAEQNVKILQLQKSSNATTTVMPTKHDLSKYSNNTIKTGIKILLEMDKKGNYIIKEWEDPKKNYELDGLILEIVKNKKGHYELLQWTEEEIFDMIDEVHQKKNDDKFWKKLHTNVNHYTTIIVNNHLKRRPRSKNWLANSWYYWKGLKNWSLKDRHRGNFRRRAYTDDDTKTIQRWRHQKNHGRYRKVNYSKYRRTKKLSWREKRAKWRRERAAKKWLQKRK